MAPFATQNKLRLTPLEMFDSKITDAIDPKFETTPELSTLHNSKKIRKCLVREYIQSLLNRRWCPGKCWSQDHVLPSLATYIYTADRYRTADIQTIVKTVVQSWKMASKKNLGF